MSELFGGILGFLGSILNGIFQVVPNYGVAIILLTILVRLVLFPLAVKQIKSMTAMQRIQPKLKELQKQHKGDRQKLNEEMMKLYREHGVNPLGGCFPMLAQLPVFIALYAVIRSAIVFDAAIEQTAITIPVTKDTLCMPASGSGDTVTEVKCETGSESQLFKLAGTPASVSRQKSAERRDSLPAYATRCTLPKDVKKGDTINALACTSPQGTGHLPTGGKLFKSLVEDKGTFLGMHLACSPTQATNAKSIRQCTAAKDASGGIALIAYFSLVVLMAGTTWYQQKQMMARQAPGTPQMQQMQLMGKIMPVFMGFLSLQFPSALSLYWVVGNFWMIGQQHYFLKAHPPDVPLTAPAKGGGGKAAPPAAKQATGRPGQRKPQSKKKKRR